jgi:hypothetical protein
MPASPRDIERLKQAVETGRTFLCRVDSDIPYSEAVAVIAPESVTDSGFVGRLLWQRTSRGFQVYHPARPVVRRRFADIMADSVVFAFPGVRRLSASGGAPWPGS